MSPSTPQIVRHAGSRIAPWAAVAGLVALASAAGGCRDDRVTYEESSQTTMALGPQTTVLVENVRGSVRLVSGDSATVRVEAHKRAYAVSEKMARKFASEVSVHIDRVGDRFEIHVEYPKRLARSSVRVEMFGQDVYRRRVDVELTIRVPRGVPTRVETRSADLFADETEGPLDFDTTSGDATIEKHDGPLVMHSTSGDLSATLLNGEVHMNTTSGDAEMQKVGGPLAFESTSGDLVAHVVEGAVTARTVSGDVTVGRATGVAQVTTVSGDVELNDATGDLTVSSSSGDVSATVQGVMQQIAIETTSGDVDLRLPVTLAGKLEVRTSSGEVEAQVPMTLERATRRQLDAVLGPGSPTTSIHTSSGDVLIGTVSDNKS
jgi:hypothetical protein